jgi:hypothetical protein
VHIKPPISCRKFACTVSSADERFQHLLIPAALTQLTPHCCVQGGKAGFLQLLSFQLPPSVPRANILLLGPPGAGKSSLVSTLDALLRGGLTRRAGYGGATTSLTLALRRYTFTAGGCVGASCASFFVRV